MSQAPLPQSAHHLRVPGSGEANPRVEAHRLVAWRLAPADPVASADRRTARGCAGRLGVCQSRERSVRRRPRRSAVPQAEVQRHASTEAPSGVETDGPALSTSPGAVPRPVSVSGECRGEVLLDQTVPGTIPASPAHLDPATRVWLAGGRSQRRALRSFLLEGGLGIAGSLHRPNAHLVGRTQVGHGPTPRPEAREADRAGGRRL